MEMVALSQSSLLLPHPQKTLRFHTKINYSTPVFTRCNFSSSPVPISISRERSSPIVSISKARSSPIVSVSKSPSPPVIEELSAEAVGEKEIDFRTDDSGGGGFEGGDGGGGGGGGGDGKGEGGGGSEESDGKKKGMSMSQKLTLVYAALIGLGGVMGYLKSGSQKSLLAGGLSAAILLYVYSQLPVRTTLASSIGFGLSAALLVVMGSRFKKSGKIFPAGVVSIVSFIMTGGYLHGIMRGMH